ncbi:hypothetical protein HUK80_13460 [Flavobacterium sp. MAH-1]|uniref:Uncharacterized protein n=1 Tax=Flavobacterium agri TaxID=2743471 RepID=A0A7Y8Y606_9FLAO|nr:DUF6520 family protein [Flavobacterium agri]NUY81906.1 hypothetical protein [Flavobacterium agri]NYA71930.1 hypothetical protein [Flavobacterium agri]
MKRKFLNSVLPAFAITLAIAGAFAAQSAQNKKLVGQTGWINFPSNCAQSRQCDTDGSVLCTIKIGTTNHQAYGKLSATDCSQTLYMPPVNP